MSSIGSKIVAMVTILALTCVLVAGLAMVHGRDLGADRQAMPERAKLARGVLMTETVRQAALLLYGLAEELRAMVGRFRT